MQSLALAIDSGLAVLIWIVQLVVYPSFLYSQPGSFPQWHVLYSRRIAYIVAPLMIAQLGLVLANSLAQPSSLNLAFLTLVLATWAITFFQFVPLHNRLLRFGYQRDTLKQLIDANWTRTALWSSIALLRLAST